jgi:hypothetical protein
VIADEEKYGHAAGGQASDTPGELALLGLAWLAALVGVPAEEDKVYAIFQDIVHDLIQGGQEVFKAGGKARLRVEVPVGLNSKMKVSKMEDFHVLALSSCVSLALKGCP